MLDFLWHNVVMALGLEECCHFNDYLKKKFLTFVDWKKSEKTY